MVMLDMARRERRAPTGDFPRLAAIARQAIGEASLQQVIIRTNGRLSSGPIRRMLNGDPVEMNSLEILAETYELNLDELRVAMGLLPRSGIPTYSMIVGDTVIRDREIERIPDGDDRPLSDEDEEVLYLYHGLPQGMQAAVKQTMREARRITADEGEPEDAGPEWERQERRRRRVQEDAPQEE